MGDFFQISTSSVNFLFASMTTLISNAMPIILPLLALIIGAWIFEVVVNITSRPKTFRYTLGEYREKIRSREESYQPANFLEPKEFELTEKEEAEEFGD